MALTGHHNEKNAHIFMLPGKEYKIVLFIGAMLKIKQKNSSRRKTKDQKEVITMWHMDDRTMADIFSFCFPNSHLYLSI